jgi:hypothetical protein
MYYLVNYASRSLGPLQASFRFDWANPGRVFGIEAAADDVGAGVTRAFGRKDA